MTVALPPSVVLRVLALLIGGASALALAGCGQKGPLTLPPTGTAAPRAPGSAAASSPVVPALAPAR